MLPLSDVLAMPVIRSAGARVLAGSSSLDRSVHWVHTSELADIGPLLRQGDLLFSTGIAMPDSDDGLREVAASLAESGAAGLVIELGRRWKEVPAALIEACEVQCLPLVALGLEVRFAAVAQAVGERIVDQQLVELREAQRVHETFTELSISEAGPGEILEAVQRLAGTAVILESEQHHVLDYRSGPDNVAELLNGWASRSRGVVLDGRTSWDKERGWLVTRVGKRDRGWGRLVVQVSERPTERQIAMAERAAATLALHRLHDRQRDTVVRRTHHELMLSLLADPTPPDLLQRCDAAGLPTERRHFVGLALRPLLDQGSRLDEVTAAAVHAAHELKVPALVCHLDGDVRALLSLARSANATTVLDSLVERVQRRHSVLAGAGRLAERPSEIDRTLREARQVADSVPPSRVNSRSVHRLDDVGLRGLLALLAGDERVLMFVGRQLGALREHDARWHSGLEAAVEALLSYPTSKSDAAASLHLSRPSFYDRLAKAERVLGLSLGDPEVRASLQVALIADQVSRRSEP